MKQTPIVVTIALACAGLSPLCGEKTGKAEVFKLAPSHADLAKRMAERTNPLAESRDLTVLDRASIGTKKRKDLGGLIGRSTILRHGGYWTMIPKGAVLRVPPAYKDRLGGKPVGKLLPWKQFYQRNRGWIHTQSVDMANARGETALSEQVLKNHTQIGRVVVAVLHHGPISVKAPQPPEGQKGEQVSPR